MDSKSLLTSRTARSQCVPALIERLEPLGFRLMLSTMDDVVEGSDALMCVPCETCVATAPFEDVPTLQRCLFHVSSHRHRRMARLMGIEELEAASIVSSLAKVVTSSHSVVIPEEKTSLLNGLPTMLSMVSHEFLEHALPLSDRLSDVIVCEKEITKKNKTKRERSGESRFDSPSWFRRALCTDNTPMWFRCFPTSSELSTRLLNSTEVQLLVSSREVDSSTLLTLPATATACVKPRLEVMEDPAGCGNAVGCASNDEPMPRLTKAALQALEEELGTSFEGIHRDDTTESVYESLESVSRV